MTYTFASTHLQQAMAYTVLCLVLLLMLKYTTKVATLGYLND